MMTKVSPVPPTPAPTSFKPRVAPGIWRDQSVVFNCYTIAAPPAVSPGSSLFPAVLQSSTSQLAMDREGGRGEAAPHTGDVLTTDLGEIGPSHGNRLGPRHPTSLLLLRTMIFPIICQTSIEM